MLITLEAFLQELLKENQEIEINDFVVWLFENVV